LTDKLRRNGQFLAAAALQPVRNCKTVRVSNGKAFVTDGPFIETKEQVGGFILIEAKNLEAAVQVASSIPAAQLGRIEVRPVKELRPSA
jgi:hypothetical protein